MPNVLSLNAGLRQMYFSRVNFTVSSLWVATMTFAVLLCSISSSIYSKHLKKQEGRWLGFTYFIATKDLNNNSMLTCDTSYLWLHSLGLLGLHIQFPWIWLSLGTCKLPEPVWHQSPSPPVLTAQHPQLHCHRLPKHIKLLKNINVWQMSDVMSHIELLMLNKTKNSVVFLFSIHMVDSWDKQ